MNVLAFDIETVPDVDAGRRLYGLEGLSDDQVPLDRLADRIDRLVRKQRGA